MVRRLSAGDEFSRYELSEELTGHHHHLLCTSCGKVFDVTPTASMEKTLGRILAELSAEMGFRPLSHSVDIMGHCSECVPSGTN